MNEEQERLLREIHATVVRGMPSDARMRNAAQEVVAARYDTRDDAWDRLKNAIADLASVLEENQG